MQDITRRAALKGTAAVAAVAAVPTAFANTEQYKAIEGECEVLDTTQDAIHSEGEGRNTSNNSDLAE